MNKTQHAMFELMRRASFNDFDADQVIEDLVNHKSLWRGAVFGRFEYAPLITLRDIEDDLFNADTLFILPVVGKENELFHLAQTWSADEVHWYGGQEAYAKMGMGRPNAESQRQVFLRVWWD